MTKKEETKFEPVATESGNLIPKAKKEKEKDQYYVKPVPFKQLFRFASTSDLMYMFTGSIGAIVTGAGLPLFTILLGDVAVDFGPPNTGDQIVDAAGDLAIKMAVLGAIIYVAAYFSYSGWMISCERQSIRIRKEYFKSLLTQEIAFYDSINPNELATNIAEECFNIQQGIGDKVSTFLNCIAMFITGFIIGYIKGWHLALVMTGTMPMIALLAGIFAFSMQKLTNVNNVAYGRSGAISEEALNSIRTVVSLGGQEKEVRRYKKTLSEGIQMIQKYIVYMGFAMGGIFFGIYLTYAIGFFIGSIFIEHEVMNPVSDKPYDGSSVLTIFFSILMAGFQAGRMAPCLKAFAVAQAAAAKSFGIIDRKSKINIEDDKGLKPTSVEGNMIFENVKFAYPSKPDRVILNEISFKIRKNEKTAFVGESGCGKTTSMQLIERFYDIAEGNGSITLDGNEIRDLNLRWMRDNIGYVGQEPVLFATSVKENMKMAKEDATDADIWEALKRANAYDFVYGLPDRLDTFVGNAGTMLSGGQKQRLAIARAILKNPKILLLDEATSALDRKNEMEIQKTLDEISEGRTTIVIAHRLSTIINADHIIVFDQGKIVEEGKHAELVAKRGRYYALQHLQLQTEEREREKQAQEDKSEGDLSAADIVEKPELSRVPSLARKQSAQKSKVEVGHHTSEVKVKVDDNQPNKLEIYTENKTDPIIRLLSWCTEDYWKLAIGILTSLVNGCISPFIALLISRMLELFALSDSPDFRSKANLYSIMFLVISFVAMLCQGLIINIFVNVGENLSRKIRANVFEKYLAMPIGWFDDPKNAPGALGSQLSTDANKIGILIGTVLSMYVQAVSAYVCGMAIALASSWKLGLIGMGVSPVSIMANIWRGKFDSAMSMNNDEQYKESSAFVAEAVVNMRTVASFGKEHVVFANYSRILDIPLNAAVGKFRKSALAFGISEAANFGVNALLFYLGAVFIRDDGLSFLNMLQCTFGVMFATFGVGNALQFAPDANAAKNSAAKLLRMIDTKPAIDMNDPSQNVTSPIKGDIEFRNVWFKYPSREKQIFSGLSFKVKASTKVAFVGPSGCGKSTILALLQRFYDVDQGEIYIDGVEIKKYNLRHLRESYGVVSQEPVLFNGTIEYNIKYAKEDATDEEMRRAAERANALKFIESNEFDQAGPGNENAANLGTGFQRKVGLKGSQMSGGQKQRLAIARAILKNPSVLILDEATSALDAENEKSVQESLDRIMEGKTSLIVAHRISTIKDADEIIVFSDGQIIERGNYEQLTKMQGAFYKLEKGINV